ncbi:hypothetical protein COV93_00250 [Candidatus Woesearchaeota archaeon CG11_big_fil_rev_8_21_14_0_20_43_8]|nr:MAG: hypothetical protein COV93_00250 [Candidatus Woesearchaeota archaeon CG11_big_fil_rev_8_21_14_0_20_43_8]PIO07037.1 MAG: hypothetical protein COT47_01835 [Candidatus Woesearchaeota archaeon CG08_land_8_20_14_0_20_43_7]
MTNSKININQNVAILCDGNNIERSLHQKTGTTNAMLNFDLVIPKLLNGRGLNRLIYFKEGRNISNKLAERLHENYYGSVVACHKSADIPLTIKATQLSSKVDTIIIMSGDSDYVELVTHLKSEGVRVEIAAVRQNAARILLEAADYYHEIKEGDFFVYNKGRPNFHSRHSRNPQQQMTDKAPVSAAAPLVQDPVPAKASQVLQKELKPQVKAQVKNEPEKPDVKKEPAKTPVKKEPEKTAETKKEPAKKSVKEKEKKTKKSLLSRILKN